MRRFAAIAIAGLVLAPLASAATKGPVFGLRAVGNPKRGYFIYPLAPGTSRTGAVIVSNTGTAAGTVKLFTADATTGRTTGTVYLTDQRPVRAGAWITLDETSLSLAPGAHRRVGFTVHPPAGVQTGQWVGGIVAEATHQVTGPKSKQKANVQIRIRDLTIVAVQIDVPGPPLIALKVGAASTGGQRGFQQVITYMENDGNILVKPTGTVAILSPSGTRLQTLPFTMDTFLPHTSIQYPVLLKKALPSGHYTVVVRLTIPGVSGVKGKQVTETRPLTVSPQDVAHVFTSAPPQTPPSTPAGSTASSSRSWALDGLLAGVALLLLAALLWRIFRRRSAAPPAAAPPAPSPPEALETRTAPPPSTFAAEPAAPPPVPDVGEPAPPTQPKPAPPAPAPPLAPPPRPAALPDHEHLWEVAYDRGELGSDGVWRFPHRCRTCGTELLARDVADATAQTTR